MEKPFVSCAVIVNDNQEYLLIRRAREPYKNHWSFISGIGASQKGLPPEEAVQDEVRYDIGVDFDGEALFEYPLYGVDYADRVYVFLGRVAENSIRLNPDAATAFRWFSEQELEQEDSLAFDDEEIFQKIRDR